ncbi:hypothetical protein KJ633_08825, partial [bacterium]|nr:hypothetical protein [bacterium]
KNNLIKYSGRKNTPGNPRLIRINDPFYHIFGIRDISDIPSWKELGGEDDDAVSGNEDIFTEEPGDDNTDSDIQEEKGQGEEAYGEETEK